VRVKICGITNYDDAMTAIDAGADALGFVFYPGSPRYITPEETRKIIDRLPPFVEKVGLFVEETPEGIMQAAKKSGITLAQIHFDAPDHFYDALEVKHLKVVRARKAEDLSLHEAEYRIVDAFVEGYGGEGKRIDPTWFTGVDCSKIILAGGLTPDNLHELKEYNFYGVDVSSGVERIKGRKDYEKVTKFIKNAKSL